MGDRVIVIFKSEHDHSPCVYGHWSGAIMPELLQAAHDAGQLRPGDTSYSAARLCGWLCKRYSDECLGVGIFAAPDKLDKETLTEFSHGDAGVLVVDVATGKVATFGGYTKPFAVQNWGTAPNA